MNLVPAEGIKPQSKRTRGARWDPDEEYIDTSPSPRERGPPKRVSRAPPLSKPFRDLSVKERERISEKLGDVCSLWGCGVFQSLPKHMHPRTDTRGNRRPKHNVKATPITNPHDWGHKYLSALARLAELTRGDPARARKLLTAAMEKRHSRPSASNWGWEKIPELITSDILYAVTTARKSDAAEAPGERQRQARSAAGRRPVGGEARSTVSDRGSLGQGMENENLAPHKDKEPDGCLIPKNFLAASGHDHKDTLSSPLYVRYPREMQEMDDEELNCRLEIARLTVEKKRREKIWRAARIKAESNSSAREPIPLDD